MEESDEAMAWENRLEVFRAGLRRAGVKLTAQRLEVFREVAASGEHPDAETIYRRVRERLPMISLDTVYRTLWLLVDLGLITTLGLPHDRTRFEGNVRRHHHFVCTRCGRVNDFYSEAIERLPVPEAVAALGRVESTQVEVRGVCQQCLEREASA